MPDRRATVGADVVRADETVGAHAIPHLAQAAVDVDLRAILRRSRIVRAFAFMSISTPCCPFTSVRDCIPINFTGLPSLILCLQASRGAGAAVLQRGVSGARAGVRLAEKVPVEV